MKNIAVVSYPSDLHARYVCERMAAYDAAPVLLDLGTYPESLEIAWTLSGASRSHLEFHTNGVHVNANAIHSVWWRRPLGGYREVEVDLNKQYVRSESEALIRSLSQIMPRSNWVSDPDATQRASRKPNQLRIAQEVGFRIPKTVLGNSARAVDEFIEVMGDIPLVVKAVNNSFIRLNPLADDNARINRVIYTQIVTPAFLRGQKEHISSCPFILQEAIRKDLDVRVTIVGNRVFAMGIIAAIEGDASRAVDWRRMDAERKYVRHDLPEDVAARCMRVVHDLGLQFGCIDLAYSEQEGYTFFEINPQGQWLVSEQVLQLPISNALLELLVS